MRELSEVQDDVADGEGRMNPFDLSHKAVLDSFLLKIRAELPELGAIARSEARHGGSLVRRRLPRPSGAAYTDPRTLGIPTPRMREARSRRLS